MSTRGDGPLFRRHLMLTLLIALISTATPIAAQAKPNPRVETARQLNRSLASTPMAGTGWKLEAIAHRWHVSPYFIIGVSGKESSLGAAACRSNPKNIWGLMSCATGPYIDLNGDGRVESLPYLRTWGHAYTWMARYIRVRQPHARTAYDISGYCECDERQWADVVASTMRRLFGVAPEVRYP